MLDLSAHQLALVRALLRQRFPHRTVRAFGSRVAGGARPFSDLDLVIMGPDPVPDLDMALLRADFEDSDLPFQVDLLEERDLPQTWASDFEAMSVAIHPSPANPSDPPHDASRAGLVHAKQPAHR